MISPTPQIHAKKRFTIAPLLLVSLSIHGLVLLVLLLTVEVSPHGVGTFGSVEANMFSVTLIPGQKSGRGSGVDTVIPDAEPGDSVEVINVSDLNSVISQARLLSVSHTEPQMVFNTESNDSLTIETETSGVARTQRKSTDNELTPTKTLPQEADANDPASVGGAGSDSKIDGLVGRGLDDERGDGGQSGPGGDRIEFFGIFTRGKRIVYVIDASESMAQHNAMELARKKLWSSLQELTPTSQFQIVFFNLTNHTMNRSGERPRLLPATSGNLRLAKQFLTGIQPDSGTDRFAAIVHALSLNPDAVFLLTDADAPKLGAKDLWDIRRANKLKALIHVVEFGVGSDLSQTSFLKTLARQNSGTHHYHDLTRDER